MHAFLPVLSHVFLTRWTVAHQTSLSMNFSRQKILKWVAISSFRGFPNPGIKPVSPATSALEGRFFTSEPPQEHIKI